MTENNEESGTGHRAIKYQNNRIRTPWNGRQLTRLKSWHNVVQEDQIGQLSFDLAGAADTEDARMMLELSLSDTINMTVLETSGHHISDEFIKMLLGLSLASGGRS